MLSNRRRLWDDISSSWKAMPKSQALFWYTALARHMPSIYRTRKLYEVDLSVVGPRTFYLNGKVFDFNISELNRGGGNAFAFFREFFVRKIYLRAFGKINLKTCLDLGCNIGLVSYILKRLGGPEGRVVGVDAQSFSDNSFRRSLAASANLEFFQAAIYSNETVNDSSKLKAACAEYGFDPAIAMSVDQIISRAALDHIDFVKMDLEGAEFGIFSEKCAWLKIVDNFAMEVHPQIGNPKIVTDQLEDAGFAVSWCCPFGYPCPVEQAGFIYASQIGSLTNFPYQK